MVSVKQVNPDNSTQHGGLLIIVSYEHFCFDHIFFSDVFSGDSGVWGLKKNFALLELLERLQNGATNQSGMAEDALKGMGEVRPAAICLLLFLYSPSQQLPLPFTIPLLMTVYHSLRRGREPHGLHVLYRVRHPPVCRVLPAHPLHSHAGQTPAGAAS